MRIKRLVELKQIEQLKKHFERGAIHYRITTNGLISYLSQITDSIDINVLRIHKDNILIKDLIYQIFEEKTINSSYTPETETLLISPVSLISDYIRDCCIVVGFVVKSMSCNLNEHASIARIPDEINYRMNVLSLSLWLYSSNSLMSESDNGSSWSGKYRGTLTLLRNLDGTISIS